MCSLQKKQLRRLIWPAGPPGLLRCCWVFSLAMPLLERDVVVGRRGEVGALLLRRSGGHELVAAAAAGVAVSSAAEELDAVGDDLYGLALGAVLRLPLAPAELAVDPDRPALGQVLGAVLGLVAEDGDAEVVGRVDPVARLVALAVVDRDPQAADRRAAGRVAELRIPRQVPDQYDAVDVRCHLYSSSSSAGSSSAPAYSGSSSSETAASGAAVSTVAGAGCVAASSRGAVVREPAMWRVAMWRSTASSILSTREISSSVAASASKTTRWYTPSSLCAIG